ncbi:MAG: hypothetical protein ACREMU_12170, partial [Gemmatimonadaceae bacterium]
ILSVLGPSALVCGTIIASGRMGQWSVADLAHALGYSAALCVCGVVPSAWLLAKYQELRSTQSVMILVCGTAMALVQGIAVWVVMLPIVTR